MGRRGGLGNLVRRGGGIKNACHLLGGRVHIFSGIIHFKLISYTKTKVTTDISYIYS